MLWFALLLATLVLTVINFVQKNKVLNGITFLVGTLLVVKVLLAEEFGLFSILGGCMGLAAWISVVYVYCKTKG